MVFNKGVSELRSELADVVDQVKYRGDRILVQKNGKPAAAIVSVEDLELLQRLEDEQDVAIAEARLKDPKQKPIPFKRTT